MTEEITNYLTLLKQYLHITSDQDDNNLENLLATSHATLIRWCGQFELDNDEGRQLVFDYVRYMRGGASEYFYKNYKVQIHSFGFGLMEVPDDQVFEDK